MMAVSRENDGEIDRQACPQPVCQLQCGASASLASKCPDVFGHYVPRVSGRYVDGMGSSHPELHPPHHPKSATRKRGPEAALCWVVSVTMFNGRIDAFSFADPVLRRMHIR